METKVKKIEEFNCLKSSFLIKFIELMNDLNNFLKYNCKDHKFKCNIKVFDEDDKPHQITDLEVEDTNSNRSIIYITLDGHKVLFCDSDSDLLTFINRRSLTYIAQIYNEIFVKNAEK